jgi:hypothetical protein
MNEGFLEVQGSKKMSTENWLRCMVLIIRQNDLNHYLFQAVKHHP